jgi:hypothetical protein
MTKLEVTKVEQQSNGRLLYYVRAYFPEGRIEFPIGIQDLGSPALDEVAVLRSTLGFADDLAASLRLRLGPQPHIMADAAEKTPRDHDDAPLAAAAPASSR